MERYHLYNNTRLLLKKSPAHLLATISACHRAKCNAVYILLKRSRPTKNNNKTANHYLFEADFNLFLRLTWVKLLNDGQQHGATPQRKATEDPILMLMQLMTGICSIPKHNLARFDNEARACYDWITVTLGMLAARKLPGIPETADQTHTECLTLITYKQKSAHGISEGNFHAITFEPFSRSGQGSDASPAVWLTLVVVLMNTLGRLLIPKRMTFRSPDLPQQHDWPIDAFVDYTSHGSIGPGMITLKTMMAKLNHIPQMWEKIMVRTQAIHPYYVHGT